MSDLYLVLRHRLEAVAVDWIEIPTPVLKEARKRKGLSYESLARELNVVAKTWERYEKAGRVPRQLVSRVAEALDLEIEQPARQRISVTDDQLGDEIRELRQTLERLLARLSEDEPPAEEAVPEAPTAR